MTQKTRLKIQQTSYALALILSYAYYVSYTLLFNQEKNQLYTALMVINIAMAFKPTKETLTLILARAMGYNSSHFLPRYQTTHPIEKKIYKLIEGYIPHFHTLCDVIIKGPLPNKYSSRLLTIIEETLKNIDQHSKGSRADVNLFVDEQQIKLFLQDDGQGFTPRKSFNPKQKGLAKIKQAIVEMGGSYELETEDGTAYWIDIPL